MRSQKQKRTWQKPELVVLVRNRPEEGVLATCKSGSYAGSPGPDYWHVFCAVTEYCEQACESQAES